MKDEYFIRVALIVSIMLHSILFVKVPSFNLKLAITPERPRELEVEYFEIKEKSNKRLKVTSHPAQEVRSVPRNVEVKNDPVVQSEKLNPQARNAESQARTVVVEKKVLSQVILDPDKKLVPEVALKATKESPAYKQSPAYLDYFQALREKVRKAIGQPNQIEEGEIRLTFTVLSSGELKEDSLKILESSVPSPFLRNLASQGVEKASPFPPFPKSLSRPSITFNLVISFEVKR